MHRPFHYLYSIRKNLAEDLLLAAAAGLILSMTIPLIGFFLLRGVGRLDPINAAAVAAHYGSVSVVTFIAGDQLLGNAGLPPAGYMVAVLALMETPAIIVGLFLARRYGAADMETGGSLWRETLLNGSVVLLVGSFVIGMIIGKPGFEPLTPVFQTGFTGLLCLFLFSDFVPDAAPTEIRVSGGSTKA